MSGWLIAVAVAGLVVVASWGLLVIAARRLPPSLLRDLAGFIPACVTAARLLRRDPRVPRRVPRDVLFEAWPAEPRLLERLLGSPTRS